MQYSVPGRPPQLHSLLPDNSLSRNEIYLESCPESINVSPLSLQTKASQGVLVLNTQEGRQVADEGSLNLAFLEPQVSDEGPVQLSLNVQPSLPYSDQLLLSSGPTTPCQAKPLVKMSSLAKSYFYLLHGDSSKIFTDRKLPPPKQIPVPDERFDLNYFTTLSSIVSAPGPAWPAGTPNYRGARVSLVHTTLRLDRWRHHLIGYEDVSVCQYLEFGFPLGLQDPPPILEPLLINHASAYEYYTWLDEFVAKSVKRKYAAGPYLSQPFQVVQVSPMMTAVKKPDGRRAVFDASFGEFSLNKGTPRKEYLGEPIEFEYPKIEDFKQLVLKCGKGCMMWKRDLSSFFLQIPLDPVDYSKVAFIWRGAMFFFIGLMFGLRNSGYQGQRITDAVRWVHQGMGLETEDQIMFNSINYSDDFGGVESTEERATESAEVLAKLLNDLGLKESSDKYHPPSTCMPYLGVLFDSVKQEMRIPSEKLLEVKTELKKWVKKTTTTKRALQQLLGSLFWVSKCVKFSRPFMSHLLCQLRDLHALADNKRAPLSPNSKLDIAWWDRYMSEFNGVELMYRDQPLDLTLEQLLDTSAVVNCGDAQMWGGGSFYDDEYWSQPFPQWLQSPDIPIHIKEFYVVLASCQLWSKHWTGKLVYIFCDNDAVVETLDKKKPKDAKMVNLLRKFLYMVCVGKFTPVFRKIGSKENSLADFLSRCHDPDRTIEFCTEKGFPMRKLVRVPDEYFDSSSNW